MLGHVLERLYGYTRAWTPGYTVQSVLNTDWAAINYAFLEYKLQRISSMLPAYTQEQIDYIEQAAPRGTGHRARRCTMLKLAVDDPYPRLGRALRPGYRAARATPGGPAASGRA